MRHLTNLIYIKLFTYNLIFKILGKFKQENIPNTESCSSNIITEESVLNVEMYDLLSIK